MSYLYLVCLCPPDMEMPQVAAGCGPNQQQDPSAGRLFTSITQHATEANYTHIIICQLKIVLPPPPTQRHQERAQAQKTLASLHLAAMLGLFSASPGKLGRCWTPLLSSSVSRHGCRQNAPVFTQGQTLHAGLAPPDPVLQRSQIWETSVSNLSAAVFQLAMQG